MRNPVSQPALGLALRERRESGCYISFQHAVALAPQQAGMQGYRLPALRLWPSSMPRAAPFGRTSRDGLGPAGAGGIVPSPAQGFSRR